ncbi:MAG: AarF/ABC1/UbiB kinase family protein [Actinobacteria bacterium]|nr:MAG: AarF/ABC1/UbiB kinase family protein [Actinomycetota bacterium]TMM14655.1 MAG: AarF/ABC1/UbiB kinase family protein [Actinomycetota bacterium]
MRPRGDAARHAAARGVRIARVVGPRAAHHAAARVTNLLQDERQVAERLERVHRESAVAATELLGGMKGGAMKLGQLASYVELDFIPAELRDLYQSELAVLRDAAPPISWESVAQVLAEEWGRPPDAVLEIERDAAAAASIGQVHRGVLPDGRRVAVKVQYPDVAGAVEADVRMAMLLMRAWRGILPRLDSSALAAELRDRVLDELDYRLETENQAVFADAYRGHPFIHVPAPVEDLCTRRVLVTEWVDGLTFAEIRALPQGERDRMGRMLFRFYLGSMDVVGRFNADPHPGNFLLMPGGRLAIVDFGAVKTMTREGREAMNRLAVACASGDPTEAREAMVANGWFADPAEVDADLALEAAQLVSGWMLEDRPTRLTPDYVRSRMRTLVASDERLAGVMRRANLPAAELWFRRLETSLVAVLAQLRACANWHRMARELWFGDPPADELARQEWDFFEVGSLWRDPRIAFA